MQRDRLWILKTHAFLHDPPHKPVVLGLGHEQIGRDIARGICGNLDVTEEDEAIKKADQIAAGADRAGFLRNLEVDPRRDLTFIHPLDAETLKRQKGDSFEFAEVSLDALDERAARQVVEGPEFRGAICSIPDERLRYFVLWRFATDLLREIEHGDQTGLGALWDVLPADTRMPNHPIAVHNSLVAALAPIIANKESPALLRVAIGPVQPFIEAARTLADLWAGSYLLSRTVFEAMLPIIGSYGPDAILFPSLKWQPLLDIWIAKQAEQVEGLDEKIRAVLEYAKKRAQERGLRIPSLPNVFVALVPETEAEALAKECVAKAKGFLTSLAEDTLRECWPDAQEEQVLQRAKRQWEDLLEAHWSFAAWPLGVDISAWLKKEAWPRRVSRKVLDALEKVQQIGGYKPNAGSLYPVVGEQASALLDAAKRDRFGEKEPREENGLKCTMCGEREVLGGTDFYEQRDLWRSLTAKLPIKESEALCGICLVKRLLGRKGPKEGRGWRHPSTTEVATSRLKIEIMRNEDLKEAVTRLEGAVQRLTNADEKRVFALPAVLHAAGEDGIWKEFAQLDGELLLPIERGKEETTEELDRARKSLWQKMKNLNLPRPSPYLAVVVFDGDEVGKWLSGEYGPSWWSMLHPKAQEALLAYKTLLDSIERPVTPAIHAALSQICASFAQFAAPYTIEREGLPGHLVYAGGDDVLFLAPPLDALRLVSRLRLRYSGYPDPINPSDDPPLQNGAGNARGQFSRPWFVQKTALGKKWVRLAFGREATASAGMCVFHAKDPLGLALERAREAEKAAKNSGRNALGVVILRRSGQESQAVLPFDRTITYVLMLARWFAQHQVSRSLSLLMKAELAALGDGAGQPQHYSSLFEMAKTLVGRVIDRRLIEDDQAREDLRAVVNDLGVILRNRLGNVDEALRQWSEIVSIAEFIARPYDRLKEE